MTDYNLNNISALIVDDYQPMRLILRNVLYALGITKISECSNGAAALTHLKENEVDIVFADNVMKPVSGIELVRSIRSGIDGINSFTPVIMISSYSNIVNILEARDAGINEFIAKPVSARLVYLRICSVIESPRGFVDSTDFFGPDRRRRMLKIEDEDRREMSHRYGGREQSPESRKNDDPDRKLNGDQE